MEDNRTSPDLFGALLNDPQLIERVSQIVAQTKTGGSADQGASAPPGGGSTDGAQPATSPGLSSENEGSQDTPPRSDTAGADSPQRGYAALWHGVSPFQDCHSDGRAAHCPKRA